MMRAGVRVAEHFVRGQHVLKVFLVPGLAIIGMIALRQHAEDAMDGVGVGLGTELQHLIVVGWIRPLRWTSRFSASPPAPRHRRTGVPKEMRRAAPARTTVPGPLCAPIRPFSPPARPRAPYCPRSEERPFPCRFRLPRYLQAGRESHPSPPSDGPADLQRVCAILRVRPILRRRSDCCHSYLYRIIGPTGRDFRPRPAAEWPIVKPPERAKLK